MTREEKAAAVVTAARGWRGTPYHHLAHVKGGGVDCAWLLIEAAVEAGVVEPFDPGPYPPDWMYHRDEERYISFVEPLANEFDWTAQPLLPADIVVWRFGRTFSHGAIVTEWPSVIHAYAPYRFVAESDVSRPSDLTLLKDGRPRPMRAFRLRGLEA